jgi:ABC-type lipoprotein release transport system permease subunit
VIRLAVAALRHRIGLSLGVVLAAALAAALVGGGLLVGDALRAALRARTEARVGPVAHVVERDDGGTSAVLAERLRSRLGVPVAATLHRSAVARSDAAARTVDLWGVDAALAVLGERPDVVPVAGEARMRADLLTRLGVTAGDRLTLRVERPSALPRDVALAQAEGSVVGVSVEVGAPLPEAWPARLGLDARPGDPDVVLVDRAWLAARLGVPDRATRLLVADGPATADVQQALDAAVSLDDGSLALVPAGDELHLGTTRVLLPGAVVEAALAIPGAVPGLVWLTDGLEGPSGSAAYAFVAARGPGLALDRQVPPLSPQGLALVAPLAERLGVGVGDRLTLRWPGIDHGRRVVHDDRELRVEAVVPVEGPVADPTWMPPIEGVAGRASCRDWDPGLTLDLGRISDADEAWWTAHGGTPQAWIALDTATDAFGGPLGDRTAVRWPAGHDAAAIDAALRSRLGAAGLGIRLRPVRATLAASEVPANDFGTLFVGFQAVLLAAALTLASLQARFAWTARAAELGTLRALGWSRRRVTALVGLEVGVAAGLGAALGVPLALGVARLLLWGLEGPWREALPGLTLTPVTSAGPVAIGVAASWAAVTGAALLAVRTRLLAEPRALLAGGDDADAPREPRRAVAVGGLAAVGAVALVLVTPDTRSPEAALAFFAAGGLAWVAGNAGAALALARPDGSPVGLGAARRRPERSRAVVALVSLGAFLVTGVGLGGGRPHPDPTRRDSGTGGFGWIVETALPIPDRLDELDPADRRARLGLDVPGDSIVPLRVLDGDDASCLQLGSAQAPTLLGVDPAELAGRFLPVDLPDGWAVLRRDLGPRRIPAVGDASTVTWGLHAAVGDAVTWQGADGKPVEVVIVGVIGASILQGALVVDRDAMTRWLPPVGGDRLLLVDGGRDAADALGRALEDRGAAVVPAAERLAAFAAVEEAYVGVFRALGSLGLALGAVGLALLVLRAVEERRGELALLRAIGFPRRTVASLLVVEHGALVAIGLGVGAVAGVVAVLPLVGGEVRPPWGEVAAGLALVGASGLAALAVAAAAVTRRFPLRDLTRERR